jgi:hypothetical protein
MEARIAIWKALVNQITSIDDAEIAMKLLCKCLGFGKFQYWSKLIDPATGMGWQATFDSTIRNAAGRILGATLSSRCLDQLELSVSRGGMELRTFNHYLGASIASTFSAVSNELIVQQLATPDSLHEWLPMDMLSRGIDHFNSTTGNSVEHMDVIFGGIRKWHKLVDDALLAKVFEASPPAHQVVLRELSRKGAAAWLLSTPSISDGLALNAAAFKDLFKIRLGISFLSSATFCGAACCDEELDDMGHHALFCENGKGRIHRHDCVTWVWYELLLAAGYQAHWKPCLTFHQRARPADVYVPPGSDISDGRAICFDAGITARALCRSPPEDAIKLYYKEKIRTHKKTCEDNGELYWPLIVSVFGHMEQRFRSLLISL